MKRTDNAEPSSKNREGVTTGHGAPKRMKAQSELMGDYKSCAEMT